jgi:adenylate cyclase
MKMVTPRAGTQLRVETTFDGQQRQKSFHKLEITIGRANGVARPDLDLSPDVNVSRRHARIWVEDGHCWIEDFGSKFGTQVDGETVYPGLKACVKSQSLVQIGDTSLRIECGAGEAELSIPTPSAVTPAPEITDSLDANMRGFDLAKTASTEVMVRQALLSELPLEFSAPECLDDLMQVIVKRVVETIPGAKRGTLLLHRAETDALVIAAFVSEEEPAVSEPLARRTLTEQKGFIWRRGLKGDSAQNGPRHRTESGMYAPLLCHGRALGVICVENPLRDCAFSDDDLRLLLTIASPAAISIANYELRDELRGNAQAMERLLPGFSPRLRARLLNQAREKRLRAGGEKSEVTVLHAVFHSPITSRDAAGVFQMLNRYFPALIEAAFSFDGAVHRFAEDAIQIVFGSPDADPAQHEKALRTAWAMQKTMREINGASGADRKSLCELGIGLHCGEAIHGFIGSSERLIFAVLGETVHAAARISLGSAAGEVLMSDEMHERTAALVQAERISGSTRPESGVTGFRMKGLNR